MRGWMKKVCYVYTVDQGENAPIVLDSFKAEDVKEAFKKCNTYYSISDSWWVYFDYTAIRC